MQDKDAELILAYQEINEMKKIVRDAEELEYRSKQQIQANVNVATQISIQMRNFGDAIEKIIGKVHGIKGEAEIHKKDPATA